MPTATLTPAQRAHLANRNPDGTWRGDPKAEGNRRSLIRSSATQASATPDSATPAEPLEQPAPDAGPRRNAPEYPNASKSYWTSGGCGAFAVALQERFPHLKIAVDMYRSHNEHLVSHCWAYDGEQKYDIFGSEAWEPSEDGYGYNSTHVILDQTPAQVDALFIDGANLDSRVDAYDTIEKMFGDGSTDRDCTGCFEPMGDTDGDECAECAGEQSPEINERVG